MTSEVGDYHRAIPPSSRAVEAMKQGAADYLSKPFSPDQLQAWCCRKFGRTIDALIRENAALRRELEVHQRF